MNSACSRALLSAVALCAIIPYALAQQQPVSPASPQQAQAGSYCSRLEAQLQAFDGAGGGDAGRADQVRKFEDAARSQQAELDRQEAAARKAGCERNSFMVLFSGQQQQCGPLNNKIQQMRDNLERIQGDLEKLRDDPAPERQAQRRAILVALSQNNCGSQYQQQVAATPPAQNGLFDSLFSPKAVIAPSAPGDVPPGATPVPSGSYKTLCVRMCDGFYFPISYATNASRFADDEKACHQSCPAAETQLFVHHNPGEDVNQAVSVSSQQPYTSLPNAFRYRTVLDKSCSCRQAGESWAQTLKDINDTSVEQGDIVVNEQRAKAMSQPQGKAARPAPIAAKPAPQAATAPQAAPASSAASTPNGTASDTAAKADPSRRVRTVGPEFFAPGQ